jgi:hypothetical protein
MKRERMDELVDIVNGLSNDDACMVINMLSERCMVFVGGMGNRNMTTGLSWATLNGAMIQINLETSEEENIADHGSWWRDSILEEAKRIRAEERAAKGGKV